MSRERVVAIAAPIGLIALAVALWEYLARALAIPPYLLPAPSAISAAFCDNAALLAASALTTLRITAGAFIVAAAAGIGLALAFSASRIVQLAAFPVVIALQVTPIVAIAPLVVVWVGTDRPQLAMLILASIVAFFPVLANMMVGLRSTDAGLRALFQLYGAGPWQRFTELEIPTALPYLLSGLKISGGLALVGAVVAEFVAGSGASQGLAWRIVEAGNRLQGPKMFAALLLLTGLGLALYGLLSLAERFLLRWHESRS